MYNAGCLNAFSDEKEFWAFSTDHSFVPPVLPGKTVIGPGSKILFDYRNPPQAPGFWFADMTLYPSHDGLINAINLRNPYTACPSCFFRCDFQSYILPNGDRVFGFTYNYGAPITEQMMIDSCNIAAKHIPVRNKTKVGFVSLNPTGNQIITALARQTCESQGFVMLTADELLTQGGSDPYIPLHPGEAYGYLRQFPANSSLLAPTDIPVFNSLPLDLSVVSGVVTSVFQTVNSHINLKSGERDTPNMILLNYDRYPCIQSFVNQPVHLSVATYGWALEKSNASEVTAKFAQRLAEKKWLALYHETYDQILSFADMCPPDSPEQCIPKKKIVGTKAASLGFLRNKHVIGTVNDTGTLSAELGYDVTPIGFGIPFQFYVDFINFPPNAYLKDLIKEVNDMEMTREPTPEERFAMSMKLRTGFWNATVPPNMLLALNDAIDKYFTPFKVNEIKLRSSSNAEDLPGFDGAGLYDSFSADVGSKTPKNLYPCAYNSSVDDMKPSTLECALKGVYGSLWNQRAIEERSFARYRHDSCVMGIAVIPRYKELGEVTQNAVSITRLIDGNTEKPGYTFSAQAGDNDVTNPEPGTQSETTIAIIYPNKTWSFELQRPAITTQGGKELTDFVIPMNLMNLMMRAVVISEKAYCLYKFNLSKSTCEDMVLNNVKTALDQEFKFLDGTKLHCKQIREFSGVRKKVVNINNFTCGYKDAGYFPPVNGITYNNIARGRPSTSGTTRSITISVGNGGSSTGRGWVNKSFDGNVVADASVVTAVDTFIEVVFDLPYTVSFMRMFWCPASVGSLGAYTRPSITLTFTFANGSTSSQTVAPAAAAVTVQLVNLTGIVNSTKARLSVSTSFLCFAELQFLAPPYITGDPNDFILENRTDTQDCQWSQWSDWSQCSVPCAGGTQTRTRGGQWCVNYITLEVFKETQNCNTFVCPVDCKWNDWTEWSPCATCGWASRSRTNVPPIGTGAQCTGSPDDKKECLLDGIPCLKAPPVEFDLTINGTMNMTWFTDQALDLIAMILSVDREAINVYLSLKNTSQYRVIISFNDIASNTSMQLPMDAQNLLAQQLSNKLVTDSRVTEFFTNTSVTISPISTADNSLGSYGIGYGVTEPSGPLPVWAIGVIAAGGFLVLVALIVGIVYWHRTRSLTVEEMASAYSRL